MPELALVRFVVEDYDASSKNDFIGQSTIPLNSLKQGECLSRAGGRAWHLLGGGGCPLKHPAQVTGTFFVCSFPPPHLPGYRHVHLLSKNGDQHPSATLFVKVSLRD